MLRNSYFAEEAQRQGIDTLPEFKQKMKKEIRVRMNRFFNANELSMEQVHALYDQFYLTDFAPRKQVIVDIAGSTDSAFADSLYSIIRAVQQAYNAGGGAGSQGLDERDDFLRDLKIPWKKLMLKDLPDDLQSKLNRLPQSAFTRPIKTPFGFFIFYVFNVDSTSEVPFDTAKFELIRLYGMREIRLKETALSKEDLQKYYRKNKKLFQQPDSITLKVWLVPVAVDTAGDTKRNALIEKSRFGVKLRDEPFNVLIYSLVKKQNVRLSSDFTGIRDTAVFSGMTIDLDALPLQLRFNVRRAVEEGGRRFIQGIITPFGTMYAKVISLKTRNGFLSFEQVKETIADRIMKTGSSSVTAAQMKEFQVLREYYLGTMFIQMAMDAIPPASDVDLEIALKNGLLDTTSVKGMPENAPSRKTILRNEYRDMKLFEEFHSWYGTIGFTDALHGSQ
jgi:hypothetical protein